MRLVIKVGTALVTDERHHLDVVFLRSFVSQIVKIIRYGHEVVIVSSGAVASGRSEMSFHEEKKNIPFRQALAAVGQGILMKTYHDLFAEYDLIVAQALLTNYDFIHRENFLNTRNVFELLLDRGAIPIVNENDVTTIAELKFGDNDMLSAKTAAMISADALLILTDVDGLFDEDPRKNPDAKLIPVVDKINESIRALAKGPYSSKSRGGMITKIDAAQYVTSVGIEMFIANGRQENVVKKIVEFCEKREKRPRVTFFPSSVGKLVSAKKWLRSKIKKDAWITVDAGAEKALREGGKSLLPSGVKGVRGKFVRGDVVMIKGPSADVGYGQINYDAESVDKIKGCRSDKIEALLGFSFEEELIHRDHLVVLDFYL